MGLVLVQWEDLVRCLMWNVRVGGGLGNPNFEPSDVFGGGSVYVMRI